MYVLIIESWHQIKKNTSKKHIWMQFCIQIMEDLIHAKFQPIHAYAHVHIAMHHPPMHVLMDAPIHAS